MPFEKSLAASLAELKEDLKNFLQTRFELLKTELSEKIRNWKQPAILFAIAGLMLFSSWLALVYSMIAVLHAWIAGTNFSWFWGGLIVTVFLLLAGIAVGAAGYAGVSSAGLKPTRTLRVLKRDQEWVQKQRAV